jgi:hypothetical protein
VVTLVTFNVAAAIARKKKRLRRFRRSGDF